MDKIHYKKELKSLYSASATRPTLVDDDHAAGRRDPKWKTIIRQPAVTMQFK